MGKQIEPQARQIILKVIQFCEEEKKKGLLAPCQQAIKRACLATGLSKHTILKIRNEAHTVIVDQNDGNVFERDDEVQSDTDGSTGTSTVFNENSANERFVSGSEPPSTLETVLVKMEPEEGSQEDPVPEYEVPENTEGEYEDDHSPMIVVKCEFESEDNPLIPNFKQEELQQGADSETSKQNEKPNKENSTTKEQIVLALPAKKQTSHTGRYECHICHKKLSASSKLKAHISLHTGEKPFSCNLCQNKYSNNKGLQRHLKTHTGKQYQCKICQKSFTENSKLNRHIKSHTGEKAFNCHICDRRFIRNEELQIHLRTHTGEKPFQCSMCDMKFTQKITLQKHIRTHTGRKTHECKVCNSWFACSSSLKVHSRTHSGVRPYACNECPRRFAQSIHLHRHVRTHVTKW